MGALIGRPAGDGTHDFGDGEFRELADNAPVMIWRSRPDKLCDWFNKPWQDFAGKSQEQLFGYGWAADVHPDDLERCVSIYETSFDARQPFAMPYRLKRHDGVYRWLLDNGAPYYRNGAFAGYFGSCIDITEQRELEEHQEVLLAELNHRVKNNLQLIISFLQLSKARARGDEAKELLQAAIGRIHGVGAVQDELHRNVSGTVDLGDYLPRLARTVMTMEGEGGATLATEIQVVRVSFEVASSLGLIVNELVTNAVKHGTAGGGPVKLVVRREGESHALVSIHDAGPGFPAEVLAAAARPGLRGLGLTNALARRCGVTLARSNEGGALVRLVFPVGA